MTRQQLRTREITMMSNQWGRLRTPGAAKQRADRMLVSLMRSPAITQNQTPDQTTLLANKIQNGSKTGRAPLHKKHRGYALQKLKRFAPAEEDEI